METPDKDRLDRARAEARVDELRLRAKHPPSTFWSVPGLLRAWRDLAQEIANGYPASIDDYTNDLDVRWLIEEVLEAIPAGDLRDQVQTDLSESDHLYREVTHEVPERIGGSAKRWWYLRVPNLIVGELARDLDANGRIR